MKVKYVYRNRKTKYFKFSNNQLCNEEYELLDTLGWTGEISINDEEIYEGDIIKDQNGYIYYVDFSNTVCNVLSFHTLCLFNVLDTSRFPLLINNNEDEFEIIGNKYSRIYPSTKKDIIEFAEVFLEPDNIFRCDLQDKAEAKDNALYIFDTEYGIDYNVLENIRKGNILIFTDSEVDNRIKNYIKNHKGTLVLETIYNKIFLIEL